MQAQQQITKAATARPLAISKLKADSLSLKERIALKPKYAVRKPARTGHREGWRRNVVVVKFVDGARVREENASAERRARTDVETVASRLDALKAQRADYDEYDRELLKRRNLTPEKVTDQMREFRRIMKARKLRHWKRVFDIDDALLARLRTNAEARKGRQASDLANYYVFQLDDAERAERLVDRLNELDIVELAYLAPIPRNADIAPATPDFQGTQKYLDKAPTGIDAKYAWGVSGGKGRLVKIVDIESGWNLNHEDLPSMFLTDGRIEDDDYDQREHGTAVMGIMLGRDDGVGVTGIVPEASGGAVSVKRGLGWAYFDNVAEAVLIAAMNLSEGDVILIEQHARGPGNDGDCTKCITDDGDPLTACGFVAMEYWNDIFDAINAATAAGIIVVEAAGNGEMNLNHTRYDDRFDRDVRNSGALLVGAGDPATHKAMCWSNHGERVDVQGWGSGVMTTGYGKPPKYKVNGADRNQWYRSSFGGTSSATPIVAGAVAAIQGIQLARNNPPLDWYEMAELLRKTGTPQTGGRNIGPLPDLKAAIAALPPPAPSGDWKYVVTLEPALLDADRAVSGFKGARTREIGEGAALGAIERLRFGERGDRPCYISVEKADIVGNKILKPHAQLDLCGDNGPTDRSLEYVPLLTTSHDTFVRGIAVCNSRTRNSTRVKGVKVYQTRIEADGSFSMISNPKTLERPNCDGNWREPAMCPSGSVATKVVVHIRPDGNDDVFTGLSLRCKKVKVDRINVSSR
ncbi:MAG TPA: S8 family peptidase [Burkholderiales bacterium]